MQFLWPCCVMKLGALPWSSCDGFVTASRAENPGECQNWVQLRDHFWSHPVLSKPKLFPVTHCSWRCRNVVLNPRNVTENGHVPWPYKTGACAIKNWHAKRDPKWPCWRTQFLVTRAHLINRFFEKKMHNFLKNCAFLDTSQSKTRLFRGTKKCV